MTKKGKQQLKMPPGPEIRKGAARHIVHIYANLVASGKLWAEEENDCRRFMFQYSLLLHCRVLGEFFRKTPVPADRRNDNIYAGDFTGKPDAYDLPTWTAIRTKDNRAWRDIVNQQLAHPSYDRETGFCYYRGETYNLQLLSDFQAAWRCFRQDLEPEYREVFRYELQCLLGSRFSRWMEAEIPAA